MYGINNASRLVASSTPTPMSRVAADSGLAKATGLLQQAETLLATSMTSPAKLVAKLDEAVVVAGHPTAAKWIQKAVQAARKLEKTQADRDRTCASYNQRMRQQDTFYLSGCSNVSALSRQKQAALHTYSEQGAIAKADTKTAVAAAIDILAVIRGDST